MKSYYPMTRGWLKLPFELAAKTKTSAWNESIFTTSSCLYLSSFRAPRLSLNSLKKNWSTQVCDQFLLCLLKLYQEYQDLEARLQERIASPPPLTFFQATCIGYVHSSSSYSFNPKMVIFTSAESMPWRVDSRRAILGPSYTPTFFP